MFPDDHVTALLAAQARARDQHRGQDVLVAHRRPDEPAARGLDRLPEPAVGQHGDHQAVAVQRPAREPLERQDPQDLVAVDHVAPAVDGDAPVRVPVQREAHVRTELTDGGHQGLGMGCPAVVVDVVAVGPVVDDRDPRTGRAEDLGADAEGGSVRGVQDDVQPGPGHGRRQPGAMRDVVGHEPRRLHGPADGRRRNAGQLVGAQDERLELVLQVVVELEAARVQHLEAVVLGRVVRGRDHDPGPEAARAGEEGQGRRRDHAHRVHVHAHAGGTGRDRRDEHVARAARVLPDHQRAAGSARLVGRRAPERERQRRSQVEVRGTPDAVGAEQAGHAVSSCGGSGRRGQAAGVGVGSDEGVGLEGEPAPGLGSPDVPRRRRRRGPRLDGHDDGLGGDRRHGDDGRQRGNDRQLVGAGFQLGDVDRDDDRDAPIRSRSAVDPNSVSRTSVSEGS